MLNVAGVNNLWAGCVNQPDTHRFNFCFCANFTRMHPHKKKVVMMTAISMGIIMFAYMIPVFVVPVALGVSEAASCTDYGCANAMFTKCGGFSAEGDSSDFMDSWARGME